MARCKRYIDTDVYTETKKRIHHIYDLFDSVVVCFSGGKDSLATLHIAWEVAQERGKTHIDVIFRDEELIPDEVINFVDEYRKLPWIKMLWFRRAARVHEIHPRCLPGLCSVGSGSAVRARETGVGDNVAGRR